MKIENRMIEFRFRNWLPDCKSSCVPIGRGEDIYDSTGKFIAGKGGRYNAHHIIEVQYRGENEW